MKRISTSAFAGAAVLAALAGGVSSASAATLSGVVVHDNHAAHSFVVAEHTGKLIAVHARSLPRVGRLTTVSARGLRNGTWLAHRIREGRAAKRIKARGAVTYVNRRRHEFVLSARGVSLLVHERLVHARRIHAAADPSIVVGDEVAVQGTIEDNSLSASNVRPEGQDVNGVDLEGLVENIDASARVLTVSADDSDQTGATVMVQVPASFDLAEFSVGEEVELIVSPNPDGTFTLEQSSDDSGGRHANNSEEIQGDDHGDRHASAEQQCMAQQADPNFPSSHNGVSFTQFYEENADDAGNAFGRCVEALADGTTADPSPELQCHTEASDPNFAASHNGLSFTQFYEQDPNDANNAFGRCVNAKAQQQEASESGSGDMSGSSDG